ncbi:MAG: MerR family transcriptional regulator [Planctomycetota bacterium]|nr:MAG: MerR family transcriptional regulator [Planctomycetota bacterium]
MSGEERWSLDELCERARGALSADYVPAASARVRALPDRRTVRYYQTAGLLDRPRLEGRKAIYGRRHLLQLVAIKRLQAEGLRLAEVQARLLGLDDDALAAVARLPAEGAGPAAPRRESFWTEAPADAARSARPEAFRPTASGHRPAASGPSSPAKGRLAGLRLAPGVALLLEGARPLGPESEAVLRRAAAPLLRALDEQGILDPGALP